MISHLLPYPKYVPARLPWFDDVPEHWGQRRAKFYLREIDERSVNGNEELLSVSHLTGITPRRQKNISMFKAASYDGHKLCQPGDVVVNTMWAWMAALGVSSTEGLVSPAYGVYRPIRSQDFSPFYLDQLLRLKAYANEYTRRSTGITSSRLRLYPDAFLGIPLIQPPRREQDLIVRFVWHMQREVGAAIRAKRRLIGLLAEEKRVITHQAVTGHSAPYTLGQNAGIPAIEHIPSHWESPPLKTVASIQTGITLGKNYTDQRVQEFPYLRVANVQAGRLDLSSIATLYVPKSEAARSTLRPGDVLMTEGGDPDKLGRGCVWNGEIANCLHQNHVFSVRPRTNLNPHFLEAVLGTLYAQTYFLVTAKQTTNLASTNKTKIGAFRIPLPRVEEQLAILAAIKSSANPLDSAIGRAEREIALLREYQTRLTADVVTGKLDVRAAAAALPDLDLYDPDLFLGEADEGVQAMDVDPEDDLTTEESM